MMAKQTLRMGVAILTLSFAVGGCSESLSNREKGALIGGGAGAAGGALIGGITGAPGTGALVGGAAGAAGGALAGDQKDKRERDW